MPLRGKLNFAQGELRIADIELTKGSAKITGEAKYRPADGTYQFQLGGAGLALNEISLLRSPRFVLGGQVGFRASGRACRNGHGSRRRSKSQTWK